MNAKDENKPQLDRQEPPQEEFLTIKEFAERAGVSMQAVYKRLKTTLQPYVSTVEGRKMLSARGLYEFEQPLSPKQSTIQPIESTVETLRETIRLLEKQLETKDEQIKAQHEQLQAKDEQIKGYSENLANAMKQIETAHALHAGTIQHDLITAPGRDQIQRADYTDDQGQEEPKKPAGLLAWLFNRK